MIIIDDLRSLVAVCLLIAILVIGLALAPVPAKPECPLGATPTMIKSSWYCVVPPEKP